MRPALLAAALAFMSVESASIAADHILEVEGPQGPLQGTLTSAAAAKVPAVVIVPGSGPTNRDGNNPLGVSASTYRLLAEALAQRGISSLRIDKRGMFGSRTAVTNPNDVTISDYASDVRKWAAKLRSETAASCVWVLGHSEGGLVALASLPDASICGLILVSAPGRRLGDVLREQLRANPANAPLLDDALGAIATLEAGNSVDTGKLNPALLPLFHPAVQGFLRDAMAYDPAKLIASSDKPVLIVQGQRDLQVSEADARRLKDANTQAQLTLLPDVNHVLKTIDIDDRSANLKTYQNATLPVATSVIDAVAEFILAHSHKD